MVNPAIPWWDRGPISSAATAGEVITVVSFNSQNTLTKSDIDQLVTRFDPDVIVLPETSDRVLRTVTPGDYSLATYLPLPDGLTSTCHGQVAPTVVLAHNRLGRIHQVSAPPTSFGTVALISQHPKLRVIGVHTAPPLPSLIPQWRADLNRLATLDQPAIPTVLAAVLTPHFDTGSSPTALTWSMLLEHVDWQIRAPGRRASPLPSPLPSIIFLSLAP